MAAALRFSEAMFVLPAALSLILERRWRDLAAVTVSCGVVGLGIQGVSDWWYWGHPFFSLHNIVTFTLVAAPLGAQLAQRRINMVALLREHCAPGRCDAPLISQGYVPLPDGAADTSYRVFMWNGAGRDGSNQQQVLRVLPVPW
jgi:hypothetical protein